jgi:hypothetical protein
LSPVFPLNLLSTNSCINHLWPREWFAPLEWADTVPAPANVDPSLPLWRPEALHGNHGRLCLSDVGESVFIFQVPTSNSAHIQILLTQKPSDTITWNKHSQAISVKLSSSKEMGQRDPRQQNYDTLCSLSKVESIMVDTGSSLYRMDWGSSQSCQTAGLHDPGWPGNGSFSLVVGATL